MLIFFNFQLKNDGENPEFLVDGWNAWFYDDIKNLVSCIMSLYYLIKVYIRCGWGIEMKKKIRG